MIRAGTTGEYRMIIKNSKDIGLDNSIIIKFSSTDIKGTSSDGFDYQGKDLVC